MEPEQEMYPLHTIRKIVTLDTGYTTEGDRSTTRMVNALLAKGWVLLNIRTVDYGEPSRPNSSLFYTLGHTDPSAEIESVRAEVEKAVKEELRTWAKNSGVQIEE